MTPIRRRSLTGSGWRVLRALAWLPLLAACAVGQDHRRPEVTVPSGFRGEAPVAAVEPWRWLTVALVHAGILHFALNMFAVYVLGPPMEQRLGRWMFVTCYLILTIAGSVAVSLLSPMTPVVGASGAIFGLLGM